MLDAGQGTVRSLQRVLDPHDLDLVGLRYLFAWGEATPDPLAIHRPPGGRARMGQLAAVAADR